jgi:DNA processing protein
MLDHTRAPRLLAGHTEAVLLSEYSALTSERAYWVAWSQIPGVGPILLKRIHAHFQGLAAAWAAPAADLMQVQGVGLLLAETIGQVRSHCSPADLLAQHETQSPNFWTPADPDYPALLWEITDPPPILYYQGPLRLNSLSSLSVGIVGTRDPSDYGSRWTRRLSQYLARQGCVIVSGLADGIDTQAHHSCLQAAGHTVAVLGTGVDLVYPRRNQALHTDIAMTGLLVSEYPNGTPPDRSHFPRRNRIIAGLSRAVLVTEAPSRSGALITAYLANDYGREVYALPGSLDNSRSQGCLALIAQGSQLILGEEQLLQALGALAPPSESSFPAIAHTPITDTPGPETLPAIHLESPLQEIFQAIADEPIALDNLVQDTQIDTGTLLSSLTQLELLGLVEQLPGMRYQRHA